MRIASSAYVEGWLVQFKERTAMAVIKVGIFILIEAGLAAWSSADPGRAPLAIAFGTAIFVIFIFVSGSIRDPLGPMALSTKNGPRDEVIEQLTDLVDLAKHEIIIVSGVFDDSVYGDGQLVRALTQALERGVSMQVVVEDLAYSGTEHPAHRLFEVARDGQRDNERNGDFNLSIFPGAVGNHLIVVDKLHSRVEKAHNKGSETYDAQVNRDNADLGLAVFRRCEQIADASYPVSLNTLDKPGSLRHQPLKGHRNGVQVA